MKFGVHIEKRLINDFNIIFVKFFFGVGEWLKCLWIKFMKILLVLVLTLRLKDGLDHINLRLRCLFIFTLFVSFSKYSKFTL